MGINGIGPGKGPEHVQKANTAKVAKQAGLAGAMAGIGQAIGNLLGGTDKLNNIDKPIKGLSIEHTGNAVTTGEGTITGHATETTVPGQTTGLGDINLKGDITVPGQSITIEHNGQSITIPGQSITIEYNESITVPQGTITGQTTGQGDINLKGTDE